MAVILENLILEKVSVRSVVDWLISGKCQDSAHNNVLGDTKLQAEFLPHFINSLRDKTAHLVCHGSSAVSSPARTPSSLQKLKRAPAPRPPRSGGSKANRTQLFAADSTKPTRTSKDFTPVSRLPLADADLSPIKSATSIFSVKSNGRQDRNVSCSAEDSGPKRKTPGSGSRKEDSITLAQFLVTPDSQSRGKGKKSPFGESSSDNASSSRSSSGKRRSGGKGRNSGLQEIGSSKGHKWKQVEKPPEFDLGNSQDFPPVGSPSVRNITPRRITPTAVTAPSTRSGKPVTTFPSPQGAYTPFQDQKAYVKTEQSSTFNPPVSENVGCESPSVNAKPSLDKERELLKQERMKQKTQHENGQGTSSALVQSPGKFSPHTPTKLLRSNSLSSMTDAVPPDVKKVTHQDKLDLIAELYAVCLHESLVPNLAVELYFLLQLLTAKGSKLDEDTGIRTLEEDIEDLNYLSSIHNCVYFAASVLSKLVILLSLLDRSTLRLLAESAVVSQFSPQLKLRLDNLIESRPQDSGLQEAITSPLQVVPFLADTDNRRNFPSDTSFHSFKKHRDGFYGLVREWEENHSKPGWKMQDKLGHRIRDLVRPMDVTNYTHFARLFQSQLIKMCQGDSFVVDNGDSQELSFIQHLRRTNPAKFKRLEDRFSTPASMGGPCPPPSFHGCQEFFKNFIVAADSYTLNQHLIGSFATKVIELNDLQLGITEQTDVMQAVVDNDQRESFSSCHLALRVLAKFLGFLVFLPYQGGDQLPDAMRDDVVALRSKAPLSVDLLGCLVTSDAKRRLILTLPWVVEFLSMMDGLAARIDHYHSTLSHLADIHKRVSVQWSENPVNHNLFLLLLLLGWLFENPALPTDLHLTSGITVDKCCQSNKPGTEQALDHLMLVDRHILYTCCPFLGDLRVLLSEASMGVTNKSTPVKKITPVPVDSPSAAVISENQIQMELERNFFHNHSTSLKKSVEFVSGRVASNCIKFIDGLLVSGARLKVRPLLTTVLASCSSSKKEAWAIGAKAKQAGAELSRETEEAARREARRFITERCLSALRVLLPCETSQTVLETACTITARLAYERTEKWIMAQIQSAVQQEVTSQLPHCLKVQALAQDQGQGNQSSFRMEGITKKLPVKPETHDTHALSPSALIQQLKDYVHGLLVPVCSKDIDMTDLHRIMDNVLCMLDNRQDLTPLAYQSVHNLTVELCVVLAIEHPGALRTPITGCPGSEATRAGNGTSMAPLSDLGGGAVISDRENKDCMESGRDRGSVEWEDGSCGYQKSNCRPQQSGCTQEQVSDSSSDNQGTGLATEKTGVESLPHSRVEDCNGRSGVQIHVGGADGRANTVCNKKSGTGQDGSAIYDDGPRQWTLGNEPGASHTAPLKEMVPSQQKGHPSNKPAGEKDSDWTSNRTAHHACLDDVAELYRDRAVCPCGRQPLLDRLLGMWGSQSSPRVPTGAFLSARTAWMVAGGEHEQARWQSVLHVVQRLRECRLISDRELHVAVGNTVLSPHTPPIGEQVAEIFLALVSTQELGDGENATAVLCSLCRESLERVDEYG